MRISSGISEINFNLPLENRIQSERAFIWPVYNAGKVESIHGVTRRTDSNAIYAKPSAEDREKIIMLSSTRAEETYTQRGNRQSRQLLQPGSLFDAVV